MATPASEDLRELERLLAVSADQGSSMSEAALQDELGVGHDDLHAMLDVLRENGKATEDAPGEWQAGEGAPPAPAPVEVHLPEREESTNGPQPEPVSMGDAQWFQGQPLHARPNVRLSRGMVAALESDALGKLIAAGIADTADGETFVLEVGP